ncbi:hypothetical protein H4219_001019 [Mycoemilia scoparia]|uniref:Uncharacterized protein n=1 Tax=Mycoemilia scoparia TaxID=417184 RepID=A0A9W8A293_9FUNG|nr:hypothetical protein H4219_001019 [Mycoemilia scoparia]
MTILVVVAAATITTLSSAPVKGEYVTANNRYYSTVPQGYSVAEPTCPGPVTLVKIQPVVYPTTVFSYDTTTVYKTKLSRTTKYVTNSAGYPGPDGVTITITDHIPKTTTKTITKTAPTNAKCDPEDDEWAGWYECDDEESSEDGDYQDPTPSVTRGKVTTTRTTTITKDTTIYVTKNKSSNVSNDSYEDEEGEGSDDGNQNKPTGNVVTKVITTTITTDHTVTVTR